MSQSDLNTLTPQLNAIADADVVAPNGPVAIVLQEARDLHKYLENQEVMRELKKVGIDQDTLSALSIAIGAASAAQSAWVLERDRSSSVAYQEAVAKAELLRADLAAACRWSLRGDPVAVATIGAIAEAEGVADLTQDLSDLAELIERHLANVDTDQTFDARAAVQQARSFQKVLGEGISSERNDASRAAALSLRDRATTHLDDIVDQIREAGRYVFRKDGNIAKNFGSAHLRELRRARNRRSEAPASGVTNQVPAEAAAAQA